MDIKIAIQIVEDMKRVWKHKYVHRTQVYDFSNGHVKRKTLANNASLGKGPKFIKAEDGKVLYHVDDIGEWLVRRMTKSKK